MIIIKLKGGLGNQMFQYACARHLAEKSDATLRLDLGWYRDGIPAGDTVRLYGLDRFSISAQEASEDEIRNVGGRPSTAMRLAQKVINKLRPNNSYLFDPRILDKKGDVYLEGFFQSEHYFKDIDSIIRSEFRLKDSLGGAASIVLSSIESTDSVAVHVRRGDYISNINASSFHGICSPEYYRGAIAMIRARVDSPRFFVFSDDIEWVQENIEIPEATYVSRDDIADHEELVLMSKCKYNIIANSSFSWWGAWLNQDPDKIVIAPKRWVTDARIDTRDAVPNEWIRI